MHQCAFLIRSAQVKESHILSLPPTLSTFSCCRENQTNVKEPPALPSEDHCGNACATMDRCFSVDHTTLHEVKLQMPNCGEVCDRCWGFGLAHRWIGSLLWRWIQSTPTPGDIFSTSSRTRPCGDDRSCPSLSQLRRARTGVHAATHNLSFDENAEMN